MATKQIASTSSTLSLKERAAAIRLARQGDAPLAKEQGDGFFATLGFATADVANGWSTARDAYTVRRAER